MAIDPEVLVAHNPWWADGKVPVSRQRLVRREICRDIEKALDLQQMILVRGPRRVGKTTILHQIIGALLSNNTDSRRIMYVSADDPQIPKENFFLAIQEFIEQRLLRGSLQKMKEIFYFFLDEAQYLSQWELHLKRYYDLRYPVKFVISSSASLPVLQKSRESLAGRVIDFSIYPFSFGEIAVLRRDSQLADLYGKISELWGEFWKDGDAGKLAQGLQGVEKEAFTIKSRAQLLVNDFLLNGGFPEYLQISEDLRDQYFWSNVVERIIYHDIPAVAEVRDKELLRSLLIYAISYSNSIANLAGLSDSFGAARPTLSNYLRYLGGTLLVDIIEKYAPSPETRLRAFKKIVVIDPGIYANIKRISPLSSGWDQERGILAEITVFANLKRRARPLGLYYWRERQKEVDFVVDFLKEIVPIEVKFQKELGKRDLAGLVEFKRRFKAEMSIVVTLDDFLWDGRRLLVPLWLMG